MSPELEDKDRNMISHHIEVRKDLEEKRLKMEEKCLLDLCDHML